MRQRTARDGVLLLLVVVTIASMQFFTYTASEIVLRTSRAQAPAPSALSLRPSAFFSERSLFTHRLRGGGAKRPKYESESEEESSVESSNDEDDDTESSDVNDDSESSSDSSSSSTSSSSSSSESSTVEPKAKKSRRSHGKSGRREVRGKHTKPKNEVEDPTLWESSTESSITAEEQPGSEGSESSALEENENEEESTEVSSMDETLGDFDSPNTRALPESKRLLSLKDGCAAENRELAGEKREIAEAPSGKLLELPCSSHADILLEGLQRLRQDKTSFDIVLVASDGRSEFSVHRSVVSAVSPELKKLIDASQTNKVVLPEADAHTLELLVNFIYTGKAHVLEENLPSLLGLCERFGVQGLRDTCAEHLLRKLNLENAIRFRTLGQGINCAELFEAAHHLIMDEFSFVSTTPAFLELEAPVLAELVGSDDLAVESEKDVFDAIVRWVEHDEVNRKDALLTLLGKVRLGLLSLDTLAKRVAASPLVQKYVAQDQTFQSMLNAAITFVGSQGESKARLEGPQTRLRTGSRGRYMVVLGGRKGGSSEALDKVWMLDRVHYDWYELEPMLTARKQLAAVELGRKLYVCGGWDGTQYLRSVEMFDVASRSWSKAPLMQLARGSFGLASMNGQLWAAGGYDGQRHLASVERYNATAQSWLPAAPLIAARSGLRLCLLPSPGAAPTLYAVGGFDGHSVLGNVERYDPATESWKQCTPMNVPRRDFALAALDGYLYAAGGFDGTKDLASVERYDPARNEWTPVANMSICRSGLGMAAINGKLHAIGGYDGQSYLSAAEVFDHKADSWSFGVEAALPARMAHFALALL